MAQTIHEIQEKIDNGNAEVLTASEIKQMLDNDEEITTDDVDVVTTGTCGVMSGTSAILHLPVAEPGSFQKASKIYLNGIEAFPGPCPNEWLGSVDLIVYGTNHSTTRKHYGGGFLIHDLIKGEEIDIEVVDIEDNTIESKVTIEDIPYAQMLGTRNAFRRYTAFTNPSKERVKSIFNAIPMKKNYKNLSFSGCGDINPLANDPHQEVIQSGTRVLVNGAEGLINGNGTRSSDENPNLLIMSDIKQMNEYYMGGFRTGMGPEVFNTVAIPIPVLNNNVLNNLKIRNSDITLPLADIHGRHLLIDTIDYSIWDNSDSRPSLNMDNCQNCLNCIPMVNCPTRAFHKDKTIDNTLCFGCGLCKSSCPYDTVEMKLNDITIKVDNEDKRIPVTCRQSDRQRAEELSSELKSRLLNNEFKL